MGCIPSDCPTLGDGEIARLRAKYRVERDRRVKRDHNDHYIPASGKWQDVYEIDPYTPVEPRAPITDETDVVILGTGLCGMMVAA